MVTKLPFSLFKKKNYSKYNYCLQLAHHKAMIITTAKTFYRSSAHDCGLHLYRALLNSLISSAHNLPLVSWEEQHYSSSLKAQKVSGTKQYRKHRKHRSNNNHIENYYSISFQANGHLNHYLSPGRTPGDHNTFLSNSLCFNKHLAVLKS